MSAVKKALLLVGSPKYKGSSSASLGVYLLERLSEKGVVTENLHINRILKRAEGEKELLEAVNDCDILILSFPLYVDSLPAGTIKALEIIARDRAQNRSRVEKAGQQVMLAICQNGFPEAHQNNTALAICRCFASEAGFTWAGGLALGGGGAIDGQPLEKLGGMMRNVRNALDLTAGALAEGRPVPEEADGLMRKPSMPGWIYLFIGNLMWKIRARKNGAFKKINDRPYEPV
ncbi:MAG: NAD(P)H-dependent oxidoreductase [Eubacteriales bacterium]